MEIALPAGAFRQFNPPSLSHGHLIRGIAYRSDGKRLMSASADGTISEWNVSTGNELRRFHFAKIVSFAASTQKWAVGLSSGVVQISCGGDLQEFRVGDRDVSAIAFADDEECIAVACGDSVSILDLPSGNTRVSIENHERVRGLAVSGDSRFVASVAERLQIWSVESGALLWRTPQAEWPRLSVAFSPLGQDVVIGGVGLQIWELNKRSCVFERGFRTDAIRFTPSGNQFVTVGLGTKLRVWNSMSYDLISTIDAEGGTADISPDGTICAIAEANDVALVDLATGERKKREFSINAAVFLDKTRIAAVCSDMQVRYWDIDMGTSQSLKVQHADWITVSPGAQMIAVSSMEDNRSEVWDVRNGKKLSTFAGVAAAFSPTDVVATLFEGKLALVEPRRGKVVRSIPAGQRTLTKATFSSDGRCVAFGSYDDTVRVLNIASDLDPYLLSGHGGTILAIAFSPDMKWLVSSAEDCSVRIWKAGENWTCSAIIELDTWVTALAFSRDGRRLIAGTMDGEIAVWDFLSQRQIERVRAHQWRVHQVSLSPDGKVVLTSGYDGSSIVWTGGLGLGAI